MSQSEAFIKKATRVFEVQKPTFYLDQDTEGVSFTNEEPRILYAGKYSIIEPDTRDRRRMIVINTVSCRMFALPKRMIPSRDTHKEGRW